MDLSLLVCLVPLTLLYEVLAVSLANEKSSSRSEFRRKILAYNIAPAVVFSSLIVEWQLTTHWPQLGNWLAGLSDIVILPFAVVILLVGIISNLAALRAKKQAGDPVVYLSAQDSFEPAWLYVGTGVFLIFTNWGEPYYLVLGLAEIGQAVMMFFNRKQYTLIAEHGIYHNPRFIPWHAIESYQWAADKFGDHTLAFRYQRRRGAPGTLSFTLPEWNIERVNSLLAQKLVSREVAQIT